MTGLLAFILFFWEYLLTVKPLVRLYTKDVISLINLHRWIGINMLVLLLLHPIALILESLINRSELLITIIPSNSYNLYLMLGELSFILLYPFG
ncbi:MAG: ferric reductase-like transmembrane domain-containing protein [Candidatus Dojkabacteria bacterium]|nr:ferric reductase-like transmembrane domain-containing protein [Candidatus Dojkabacteria bacterium]